MFFIRVFQQERLNRFLWVLPSLTKNDRTFRKYHLFSCTRKNFWDIGKMMQNRIFTKNVNIFWNPGTDFPLSSASRPQWSLVLYHSARHSLKSWPSYTTRCAKCWSNLTWKCYANTFGKVDAQLVKECWRTISYRKFYCKKLSNQKPTANTVSATRRTTLCWMRGEIKEHLFVKLTLYLCFSVIEVRAPYKPPSSSLAVKGLKWIGF